MALDAPQCSLWIGWSNCEIKGVRLGAGDICQGLRMRSRMTPTHAAAWVLRELEGRRTGGRRGRVKVRPWKEVTAGNLAMCELCTDCLCCVLSP